MPSPTIPQFNADDFFSLPSYAPHKGAGMSKDMTQLVRYLLAFAASTTVELFKARAIRKGPGSEIYQGIADAISWQYEGTNEALVTGTHRATFQKEYGGVQRAGEGPFATSKAMFIPVGVNSYEGVRASTVSQKFAFKPTRALSNKIRGKRIQAGKSNRFARRGSRQRAAQERGLVRQAAKGGAPNEVQGVLVDSNGHAAFLLYSALQWTDGPDKWMPKKATVDATVEKAVETAMSIKLSEVS